jgi:NADH:ubiquinone reductase (non-electrogenic)
MTRAEGCTTCAQIKAVEENRVLVLDQGSEELRQVPFGTCIWTTGIRMHPLSERLAEQLQAQEHW